MTPEVAKMIQEVSDAIAKATECYVFEPAPTPWWQALINTTLRQINSYKVDIKQVKPPSTWSRKRLRKWDKRMRDKGVLTCW